MNTLRIKPNVAQTGNQTGVIVYHQRQSLLNNFDSNSLFIYQIPDTRGNDWILKTANGILPGVQQAGLNVFRDSDWLTVHTASESSSRLPLLATPTWRG